MIDSLPPGQRERADFPRFGLRAYAFRFPRDVARNKLTISGDVLSSLEIHSPLGGAPRIELRADFHCVTTWTRRDLVWGGVLFADFFRRRVQPLIAAGKAARAVVIRGEDGYRTSLPLADLLAADVLLADSLDGKPLTEEHGAPFRLIAPAHYGYKSVKHLAHLEFMQGEPNFRPAAFAFMDHPRARVAYEERGRFVPGPVLRYLYRPLIDSTVALFARANAERRRAMKRVATAR